MRLCNSGAYMLSASPYDNANMHAKLVWFLLVVSILTNCKTFQFKSLNGCQHISYWSMIKM